MTDDVDTSEYEIELYEPDDYSSKVRMYLVTINNYTQLEIDKIERYMNDMKTMKYAVIGWETAPTTGTPHIHVYFHWVSSKSFTQMKKKIPSGRYSQMPRNACPSLQILQKRRHLQRGGGRSNQWKTN